MSTDLKTLSLSELRQLRKDVEKAISTYKDRQRRKARTALEAKAKEFGFSLDELTNGAKSRGPLPPKYRHPENPEKTWSGRGRHPAWFKEALKAGISPEDLEIK